MEVEEYIDEGLEHGDDYSTQDRDNGDVIDRLRDAGIDDDLVQEIQKGYLRQSDYTRKRQAESSEINTLKQQVAALAGYMQGKDGGFGNDKEADPLEAALAEFDDGSDQSAAVKQILTKFGRTLIDHMGKQVDQRVAPVREAVVEEQYSKAIDKYVREKMVTQYTPEVRKLMTPEVREQIVNALRRGERVVPEMILFERHPERMASLMVEAKRNKNERQSSRHTEGLTSSRRSSPPNVDMGRLRADSRQTKTYQDIDADAMYRQTCRELGINP